MFLPGGFELLIIAVVAFLLFGIPLIAVIVIVVVISRRNRQAGFVEESDVDRDEIAADE